ncbi:MAG: extracellular solute-binding protein [Methanomassiliicoccales archaeon]|nr:extracellular solute-binding protein [Methanomassiliicoccales archaeon]
MVKGRSKAGRWLAYVLVCLLVTGVGVTGTETLRILMFSSFVKDNDEALKALAAKFGEERGVNVVVEFVSIPDMYARAAAEAEAKAGHDIIGAENLMVSLYKDLLVPIDDVVQEIIDRWGPFHPIAQDLCYLDGHWKGLPIWAVAFHGLYRKDYLSAAGVSAIYTWDDLLTAAPKLWEIGHPIAFAISSTGDANNSLMQIMWGFGAKIATEEGVVAIDSPETRRAIEYVKKLFPYMPPEVLGWDNAGNNTFILSGVGSWTLNPISVLISARRTDPDLAAQLRVHGAVTGPAGTYGSADVYHFMIWNFSPNIELAKDFLRFLYQEENMYFYIGSGKGFNMPLHPRFDAHPVFYEDPVIAPLVGYMRFAKYFGWPAPPDGRAQMTYTTWVIPTMFYKVVTGMATVDQAIKEAEEALIAIGYLPKR